METKTTYVRLLLFFSVLFSFPILNQLSAQILLQSSFEGTNPFSGFTNNQSCCSHSVTSSTVHANDGAQSYRSQVRQGDPSVSSGWRAELTTPGISDQGNMWYGFSVLFEQPASGQYWTGSYGGHFVQWHPNNGSGSAELAIYGSDGNWDVTVNPTGGSGGTHQTQTASGGPLQKITANVWHDVVFHVQWGSGGMVEVWIDGVLYFTKSNLNWAPGAYFKFGMNRWGNCSGSPCDTWTIYYDNLKIGRNVTYNDVAPSATTPANQAPTANAGNNAAITLPTISTTLNGSGTDPDGTIANYAWSKVSGPASFSLTNPVSAVTALTALIQGTYVFRLTVTDNNGATDTDDVTVTVNPLINLPPIANAGSSITLTLPVNTTSLTGSGSDVDGTITAYAWSRVSGPTTFTLGSPNAANTTLSNLLQGTYIFRLTVTDNAGQTATDDVTVTVNPAANQAPTANAGANITLTLPVNSTSLAGSGADTDGTITTYAWTRVSGPLTYTFGTPNAGATTLNNLIQGIYVLRLTVTDNSGATDTDDITVTVNAAANQPPTANAGNNIVITLPISSTTLTGSGSDPDGSISSYSWTRTSGPTTFTLGSANLATTTLSNLVQGIYTFRLTVTDNSGATAIDDVNVTVNPAPNQVPTANAGNNIVITLPVSSTTLAGSGTDPDGTITNYSWTRLSGPTTFTIANAAAASTGLTGLGQGVYTFRLTVTDNSGATAADDVTITVNAAPNQAPTANAGNNIVITLPVNSTSLSGSGTDADGTINTYAWTRVSGPTTFTITNAAAAATTLTGLVQGVYTFRLTVTDNNGAVASDEMTVTVNAAAPVNQSPIANAGNNIVITLPVNSTTITGSGTDADGTIVTYAWTGISGPVTYTIANAAAASTGLTGLTQGVYTFRLTVTDNNGATATDDVTVTVNAAANSAPIANAGTNIVLTLPLNSTTLTGAGTDVDGTISTYSWTRVSGPLTFTLGNAAAASTALTGLVQGVYTFRLTVTDNNGGTGTDEMTITVNSASPTNQPPIANGGNNIVIGLPTNSTTLNGSNSTDADGTIVSYSWTNISGPASFTIANTTSATTALTGLVQGVYTFRLTVTDNSGATDSDNMTVTVNAAANQVPGANAGNNIVLTLPANSTTLSGSGSDLDGTIVSYAWSRVSGPTVFTIVNVNTASTSLNGLVQGSYVFRLTVTDNAGATASDDVTVTVNPAVVANLPPIARAGNDILMTLPANTATLNANTSTDADGTIVSYSWSRISGPTTFTLTSAGSIATGLNNLIQGVYVFRITVTDDDGASATDDITVTVNAASNQVPLSNAGNDIILTLPVNSTILNGSGTDADGTIVSYNWSRISGPATFILTNASAASTNLTGLVQGTYVFRLTVTDNAGATGTDNVTITVNASIPGNQAPTANAGNDITITLPTNSTTLTGSGSDPGGSVVSYSWSRVSGPATYILSNANSPSTGLTNLVVGTYQFRLTVTDNFGATGSDIVFVNVVASQSANQAPTARTNNDILITLPVNYTSLNGSTSTDVDGIITGYEWTQLSGPIQVQIGAPLTANASLTGLTIGEYIFQLKVTDDDGASAIKTIRVTVRNKNGRGLYFNVFPNPTPDNLTIQYYENGNGKLQISVFDATRRLVKNEVADKNQVTFTGTLDVNNLKNGVYIIQIILPNGEKIAKQFVKM